jgi:hypothetical protein
MKRGFVRAYRKLLKSPIFKKSELFHFWMYCLLKATHVKRRAMVKSVEVDLEPGQFIFGRQKAEDETGISARALRTAVAHLLRTNRIKATVHPTKQFSIITICAWAIYQSAPTETDQPTDQRTDQRPTRQRPTYRPQTITTEEQEEQEEESLGTENDFGNWNEPGIHEDALEEEIPMPNPEEAPPAPEGKPARKPRPPDVLWDALLVAFPGLHPDADRGMLNHVVKQLRIRGAQPGDIRIHMENYRLHFPDAALTPTALNNQWAVTVSPPRGNVAKHAIGQAVSKNLAKASAEYNDGMNAKARENAEASRVQRTAWNALGEAERGDAEAKARASLPKNAPLAAIIGHWWLQQKGSK